jgi:hypothetical protein
MKTLLFSLILIVIPTLVLGQNESHERSRDLINVQEDPDKTVVTFPGGSLEVSEMGDTITRIRIGQKRIEVLENEHRGSTRIRMVHVPREKFKGHWAGVDLGFNNFLSSHFSSELPDDAMFMDLNTSKSVAVGINLLQYSIGLQRHHNNIGLITGMGLTYNNYRLDSPNILMKDDQGHTSYEVTTRDVKKNKLATAFLTVPLLLEVQIPTASEHPFFINGGLYGGFKLGSHTKVVYANSDEKEKSHSDLNVNSFKYGATIRFGYRFLKLHASCDLSQLFQDGQGPRLYPWTVGLTLVNF